MTTPAAAPAQRNILDIPYEVLDLIYKELNYLSYKVNLAMADPYLGEAFAFHSRQQFESVTDWQYIGRDSWPVILSYCGTTVREYSCCNRHSWSDTLAKLVERHCPNLERVEFDVGACNCNSVRSVIANAAATLKEISLNVYNRVTVDTPPMRLHEFPELPRLRKGTFKAFPSDEVVYIQKFSTLEELILKTGDSESRETIKLFEITANLRKLRSLKLFYYNLVESGNATSMAFPTLEYLQIDGCEISTEMPCCPKLTSLDIFMCTSSIENELNRFILRQGDTLVTLRIHCRPSLFDGEGFLEILRCCKRLRLFYLQAQKVKFTRDLVATMMEILQHNGATPDDPLRLLMYYDSKVSWIEKWVRLTPNPKSLSVGYWLA